MITRYRFTLPFKRSFFTSAGLYTMREGLVFCDETKPEPVFTEASPLPGFSNERLDEVAAAPLIQNRKLPSLQFALDSFAFLNDHSQISLKPVPVNAVIPDILATNILETIAVFIQDGYRCLKFKCGRDTKKEIDILNRIRSKYPDIAIRLDANGVWNIREAEHFINHVHPLTPEYIEQPVSGFHDMIQLKTLINTPIAADEMARSKTDIERIIRHHAADVIVVKPMLTGPIEDTIHIIKTAEKAGIKTIITTSLDAAVGRNITALIASYYGNLAHHHGLATGQLFANDLSTEPDDIRNGYFYPKHHLKIDMRTLIPC